MPQIEHIEIGLGTYPPFTKAGAPTKQSIFIITGGADPDYVMGYSEDLIKKLCRHMYDGDDIKFTTDGSAADKRNIVKKNDKENVSKDHVFYGCLKVEKKT